MYTKKCDACGAEIKDVKWQSNALCPECRDKLLADMRDAKPERVFPAGWSLDDKIDKARELGISYGQFVARVYDGQYDMKTLKKAKNPKPLARQMRRELWQRVK